MWWRPGDVTKKCFFCILVAELLCDLKMLRGKVNNDVFAKYWGVGRDYPSFSLSQPLYVWKLFLYQFYDELSLILFNTQKSN